jgi:hypothetical protein
MPKLNWRKRDEHSETFEDVENLLVACIRKDGISGMYFENVEWSKGVPKNVMGERWEEWSDVDYWLPLSELSATLPQH